MTDGLYKITTLIISIFSIPVGIYYALLLKDRLVPFGKCIIPKLPESMKLGFRISIFIYLIEIAGIFGFFIMEKIKSLSPWISVLVFNLCIFFGLPFGFWIISTIFKKYFDDPNPPKKFNNIIED